VTHARTATLRSVQAAIERHWVQGQRPERLMLLSARPEWDGAAVVTVGDVSAKVMVAVSTLAVRDAITTVGTGHVVVLTDVSNQDLGADLLSRAVKQQVLSVDLWDTVRLAFGLKSDAVLDGSLVRDGDVIARALVDGMPRGGWGLPPSGVLTRDHAYRGLARQLLHIEPSRLDAAGLLDWSRDHRGVLALHDLDRHLRDLMITWLMQRAGVAARPILDLAVKGEGGDAVPLGLVAGLLWRDALNQRAQGASQRAQGWLEQRMGHPVTVGEAHAWDDLASGWVERRLVSDAVEAETVLARGEELLDEMHAGDVAEMSILLPTGLTSRCRALGKALADWVKAPGAASMGKVESALAAVLKHQLADLREQGGGRRARDVDVLEMAVRLVRWLSGEVALPENAAEALMWQIGVGGWVDRARQIVANGATDSVVGGHLKPVYKAASVARARIDLVAAQHVSAAVASDQSFGSMLPVEDALPRLMHVAASTPVLLVVLDGMSAAVASEVAESVTSLGWIELGDERASTRLGLMAALPTVTNVSRTSLLCGSLTVGGQAEEKKGFRSACGATSRLFHQRDLESDRGGDLAVDVREAVLDSSVAVVGVVLNAVDNSLAGGDPARTSWTVSAVGHLRPLLERAAAAGRVVVLTSDHGHVVDQPVEGELRSASGGGARWRPATGTDVADIQRDEVRLNGRRVLLGNGDVIAAVSETLRYRPRKEGYHGGAALAEMAIPWIVLARRGIHAQGHVPIGDQAPSWWRSAEGVEESLRRELGEDTSKLF
jgi:PglZ domain